MLVEGVAVACSFEGVFSRWKFRQVLWVVEMEWEKRSSEICPYSIHTQPKFVNIILRPFFGFIVCPEVMPSVPSSVIDEKPPTRVVCERVCRGMRDIEWGIHESRKRTRYAI